MLPSVLPVFGWLLAAFLIIEGWRGQQSFVAAKDGLLANGNFEYGPKPSALNGTEIIGRHSLPYWEIKGFVEYISSGHKQGDMLLVVPQGAHAARLGNEAQISQRIRVRKGSYYSLTFSAARTCAQAETLNVSVPPDAGAVPMQTLYSSTGWDAYAWAFRAAYNAVDVILHNPGVEDDPACGPLIDAIAIRELFPPRYAPGANHFYKEVGLTAGSPMRERKYSDLMKVREIIGCGPNGGNIIARAMSLVEDMDE